MPNMDLLEPIIYILLPNTKNGLIENPTVGVEVYSKFGIRDKDHDGGLDDSHEGCDIIHASTNEDWGFYTR